jgi:GDP-L-fucose synthase
MRLVVTGAEGMLGRTLLESWARRRPNDEVVGLTRAHVDLRDADATLSTLAEIHPDAVVHAAAKVGGVGAKIATPVPFLLDNLRMDSSVIAAAIDLRVPELLYLGSAAVYPADSDRAFVEADFLTGALEGPNEGYALAKIAGSKLCEYASAQYGLAFRAIMPSNLYGPHDHFDSETAHLISAAIGKVHWAAQEGAASVEVWGDGTARREFTFAGDLADWVVDEIGSLSQWPMRLNVGEGVDHSIADYYRFISDVVGYRGELRFDPSKPSGVSRRLLDSSAAREHGWNPTTSIRDGIAATYADFLSQLGESRS